LKNTPPNIIIIPQTAVNKIAFIISLPSRFDGII